MKVSIATSRAIGEKCLAYAKQVALPGVEIVDDIEECDVFISVLYDKLLTKEFIDGRDACFNFHPGLLPKYRGSGAYSWAIINHEMKTGVTLHLIDPDIDHGPVLQRREFFIKPSDTAGTLFAKAEDLIFRMFQDWYAKLVIEQEIKVEKNSNEESHIYYRKDLEAAKDITRFVRAFTFPGKESCYYVKDGKKIYIEL